MTVSSSQFQYAGLTFHVLHCAAYPIPADSIVDTTGAGDAYIGGFVSALLQRCKLANCMKVGTMTATEKLRALGSRDGLPTADRLQSLCSEEH